MTFKPAKRPTIYLPIPLPDDTIKVYPIKAPSAEVGTIIKQAHTLAEAKAAGRELTEDEQSFLDMSQEDEERFDDQLFGGLKQQMLTDGVDAWTFGIVRMTVTLWVSAGKAIAEWYWNQAFDETAVTDDAKDSDEAEQAPKDPDSSDAEKSGRPDSTDGSTTPKPRKQPARKPRAKRTSTGSKSSATGTRSKPTSTNATE